MNKYTGFSASLIDGDLKRERVAQEKKAKYSFNREQNRMYTIGLLCGYAGYTDLSTLDNEYTQNDNFKNGYRCGKTRKLSNYPLPKISKY